MGIAFGLVVNFGVDEAAAWSARDHVLGSGSFAVGHREVVLHPPQLDWDADVDGVPYLLMSILPIGVGRGLPLDRGHEPVRLSAAELTDLGSQLYGLLREFSGYRAARVGWDPYASVDLAELERECADLLEAGTLPGLVLFESVLTATRGAAFVPFAPWFVWIPYASERASSLTADDDNLAA